MSKLQIASLLALMTALAPISTAIAQSVVPLTHPPCDAIECRRNPGNPGGGDKPDSGSPVIPLDAMIIGCRVSGDPEILPDDLKFRNIGGKTIPAGTRVYWLVKATGDHGYYFPPTDILPGHELPELNVLVAGTPSADHCRSMIM